MKRRKLNREQITLIKLMKNCNESLVKYNSGNHISISQFWLNNKHQRLIENTYINESINTADDYDELCWIRNKFIYYLTENKINYKMMITDIRVMYKDF